MKKSNIFAAFPQNLSSQDSFFISSGISLEQNGSVTRLMWRNSFSSIRSGLRIHRRSFNCFFFVSTSSICFKNSRLHLHVSSIRFSSCCFMRIDVSGQELQLFEIEVLYILILFASFKCHAYVATMFMQALDYSFQHRVRLIKKTWDPSTKIV